MKNVISQSLGLDLVNFNVYAKVCQNIPLSSRDRAIFTFSEFEPGNASANPRWHLTISWATPCRYQCVCKIWSKYSKRFKSYRHFLTFFKNRPASKSLFQNLNLGNASANPKWRLTISWATSCQYQCICKILTKYSKRFKSYQHFSRTGGIKIFTNCPVTKSNVCL